jgi:hypothetical protein
MKKPVLLLMLVLMAVVASLAASAGNGAEPRAAKAKAAAPKVESYVVVQIGDEVKVVTKSELKNLTKTVRDEDKKRKEDYEKDKKTAAKNKEKFDTPKPSTRKVTKLKEFKSEQEANDWLEKHPRGKEEEGKTAKKTANW